MLTKVKHKKQKGTSLWQTFAHLQLLSFASLWKKARKGIAWWRIMALNLPMVGLPEQELLQISSLLTCSRELSTWSVLSTQKPTKPRQSRTSILVSELSSAGSARETAVSSLGWRIRTMSLSSPRTPTLSAVQWQISRPRVRRFSPSFSTMRMLKKSLPSCVVRSSFQQPTHSEGELVPVLLFRLEKSLLNNEIKSLIINC